MALATKDQSEAETATALVACGLHYPCVYQQLIAIACEHDELHEAMTVN